MQRAESHAQKISSHAEDAVFHLQIGDIVRQKLEHVAESLSSVHQPGRRVEPGVLARVLALQAGQIEAIELEINSAHVQLGKAFGGLTEETNQVVENVQSIQGGPSAPGDEGRLFEALRRDLGRLE